MSKKVLLSWLGIADLKAAGQILSRPDEAVGDGPILGALKTLGFDELHLLYDQEQHKTDAFIEWLQQHATIKVVPVSCSLRSPIDFGDIHRAVDDHLQKLSATDSVPDISIHLSPGTPSMTAVSILLGKTRYNTRFVQSTKEKGGEFVNIPFDISAEFVPQLIQNADKQLTALSYSETPKAAAFTDIITQSPNLLRIIQKASKIAIRDVPVLIMGESGTGKELFAKAIHNASQRSTQSFVVVNCGAIPKELIDSELFGHIKGAFTGAVADKKGYFEAAHGGTLFLDEFGELPEEAQVRLLRVLQSGEISKVGDSSTKTVNVRIIAATNRNLSADIVTGRFREDLFYRIAVGIISLPPLRERTGDVALLAEYLMNKINADAATQPGYVDKNISIKAKNIILNYTWPGNIRELHGTLLRASIWSDSDTISEFDLQEAMIARPQAAPNNELPEIGEGLDIQQVLDGVKRKYINKALEQVAGNKKKATELLGLPNYQTLTNWMEKLGIQS